MHQCSLAWKQPACSSAEVKKSPGFNRGLQVISIVWSGVPNPLQDNITQILFRIQRLDPVSALANQAVILWSLKTGVGTFGNVGWCKVQLKNKISTSILASRGKVLGKTHWTDTRGWHVPPKSTFTLKTLHWTWSHLDYVPLQSSRIKILKLCFSTLKFP